MNVMTDELREIKSAVKKLQAAQHERELALENLRGQIERGEHHLQELDAGIKKIRDDINELKQAIAELRDFKQAIEEMRYIQTITCKR